MANLRWWRFVGCVILGFCGIASRAQLSTTFYSSSCPNVLSLVRNVVLEAVKNETRMAASLLRLHFHDCFVNGCDGSILLDDTATFTGEKTSLPNNNSARGFEVIDAAKTAVESACNQTVSCADILAIAARDSVLFSGGPSWQLLLGRRDSTTANRTASNTRIPAPTDNLTTIVSKFEAVGLDTTDVVVLSGIVCCNDFMAGKMYVRGVFLFDGNSGTVNSGAHTIGRARCTTFINRLYDFNNTGSPDSTIDAAELSDLQSICPLDGDNNTLAPLDHTSIDWFDNSYFKNLQNDSGLLQSDQELYSTPDAATKSLVDTYSLNQLSFFVAFKASMIKMGSISPLTGTDGEIRKNCRAVNS